MVHDRNRRIDEEVVIYLLFIKCSSGQGRTYERIKKLQRREDVEAGAAETRPHQTLIAHLAANMPASHHEDQRVVGQCRY